MSIAEIISMAAWAFDQIAKLVAPKSGAMLAADKVVQALAAIYGAVQDVTYGVATPAHAQAQAQSILDQIAANDAAADAAADAKP